MGKGWGGAGGELGVKSKVIKINLTEREASAAPSTLVLASGLGSWKAEEIGCCQIWRKGKRIEIRRGSIVRSKVSSSRTQKLPGGVGGGGGVL